MTSPKTALEVRDGAPKAEEIREHLRAMLASPAFQGSRRCQQFLEYVTEKTLAGESGTLKERTIAVEVFGRDLRSDAGDDTIVRVGAREVRKRLAQYYVSPEGVASPFRIELPSGTYAPEFRVSPATPAPPVVEAPHRAPEDVMPPRTASPSWLWLALAFALAGAAFGYSRWWKPDGPFEVFWAPVFASSEPVLVAMANPLVYHPSARAQKLSEDSQGPPEVPGQRPLMVRPELLNGSDIVPVFNQYVGVGDMVAATEAGAMLARHGVSTRVRLSTGVEFADLRGSNTLLIGAVTNRWTMEMQKNWRFQFRREAGVRNVIVDTLDAGQRQWSLPIQQDGSAQEDYILLCRIPNSFAGGLMLVTAGMRQFGTEAGGRVLSDRRQLTAVLSKLPAGWESKNLQVVLHVRVIGNAPAQPDVVAWQLW